MPGFVITPVLQDLYGVLIPFVISVTGLAAASVVQGLPNRAPMPLPGFISIQALFRHRLRTNLHEWDEISPLPTMANLEEGVELTTQIDCYGPSSEDWASMLSATLRDEYGCTALAPTLSPLYADDARMIPLVAGENQYEERWSLDARFQYNPVTTLAQQYARVLALTLIDVQEKYPA
jgi:hypothetical protein